MFVVFLHLGQVLVPAFALKVWLQFGHLISRIVLDASFLAMSNTSFSNFLILNLSVIVITSLSVYSIKTNVHLLYIVFKNKKGVNVNEKISRFD